MKQIFGIVVVTAILLLGLLLAREWQGRRAASAPPGAGSSESGTALVPDVPVPGSEAPQRGVSSLPPTRLRTPPRSQSSAPPPPPPPPSAN
jgi:hypothetical protein